MAGSAMSMITSALAVPNKKESLVYTFAYWLKWKPVETLSDQLLFFGESRNMPALVRANRLGALVDNEFCATAFDPRLAGDNWSLLVVTNDGTFSKFYIGYASNDLKGVPQPCKALEKTAGRGLCDVKTVMGTDVQIKRLVTTTKGAGFLAQAWVWARDLEPNEIHELWVETKSRYPLWKPGISAYRPPPTKRGGGGGGGAKAGSPGKKGVGAAGKGKDKGGVGDKGADGNGGKDGKSGGGGGGGGGSGGGPLSKAALPWDKYDPIIEKDNSAMLDVSLSSKLAFQRLLNVFQVLVDYASYSNSCLCIDRVHNPSPTAELMIECALRKNGGTPPMVLVMDSRPRLEAANKMLNDLIEAKFLIHEETAYRKKDDALQEPRLTEYKLTSSDYVSPKADLRRLVTPAGLAWLRASSTELKSVVSLIDGHERHPKMCAKVQSIYREAGFGSDLNNDGRPKLNRIWRVFYQAQLFASGTHYIIFDTIEPLAKPVVQTMGTLGCIFVNGSTEEHKKIVEVLQEGSPLLLLESTGGVTQAFAYVMKCVRMMKPKWDIDFVLRLVTEYKQRAANIEKKERLKQTNRKFLLDNIQLLDKQLARIDLLLNSPEQSESWMKNFGLPEMLMLFEVWQRSPEFLLKQVQLADVMKKSAESLLDLFTGCFSGGISIPELGLGNAETKVVATAWNRHLMLWNNAAAYAYRSEILQYVLYFFALLSTTLSVLIGVEWTQLKGVESINIVMLVAPIISALLGTISTRLRQRQKYSMCKMAAYEIVSEIYKFRVRAMEYDQLALAAVLRPPTDDKKADDEPVAPISNKEKDKLARRVFVERVQMIYTNCMESEMSKGTSIRHRTGGMDPQRMLMDGMDEDSEKARREALLNHLAVGVYKIKTREWVYGAQKVRAELLSKEAKRSRKRKEMVKRTAWSALRSIVQVLMLLVIGLILAAAALWNRLIKIICCRRKKRSEPEAFGIGAGGASGDASGKKKDADEEGNSDSAKVSAASARLVHGIQASFKRVFKDSVDLATADGDGELAASPEEEEGPKKEMLDTTYNDDDDDAEMGGGDAAGGGGGGIIRDNLLSPITIDDFMHYRCKPISTHCERTAPWLAFKLQIIEICIFTINSSGAVLVGVGEEYVPYVAITVAIASALQSWLEFTRIGKKVEAYNSAQRDLHNLINSWDGMTRTERRTRKTVQLVVTTVEKAMQLIAIAYTDAIPSDQAGGGEGEEEGQDEKKE